MAIAKGDRVLHAFMTLAQYNTLKTGSLVSDNTLYFLTDTHQIYLGQNLYSGTVEFVESFPVSPSQGILYCNAATHETKMWDGSAWKVVVPPVVSTIIKSGQDATPSTSLADVGAIKAFVAAEIGDAYTITKADDADEGFVATYQLFKGSTAVGDKINIPRDFLVKSATLRICEVANTPVTSPALAVGDPYLDFVINTKDNSFIKATGTYVPGTVYYTTIKGTTTVDTTNFEEGVTDVSSYYVAAADSHIYINVKGLVEFPTVDDTATVDLTIDANHKITADVNISAVAGNTVEAKSDGIYVATPHITSTEDTTSVDLDVTNGKLTAAVKIATLATAANQELKLDSTNGGLYVDLHEKYYTKSEVDAFTTWQTVEQSGS